MPVIMKPFIDKDEVQLGEIHFFELMDRAGVHVYEIFADNDDPSPVDCVFIIKGEWRAKRGWFFIATDLEKWCVYDGELADPTDWRMVDWSVTLKTPPAKAYLTKKDLAVIEERVRMEFPDDV